MTPPPPLPPGATLPADGSCTFLVWAPKVRRVTLRLLSPLAADVPMRRHDGGYHAAREEQGQQEARIRQLQELLNNAKVGEAPKQSGVALPGSVVTVYYGDDKSDKETFLIATRQEGVSDGKLEVYSPNSPLGGALIDAKEGECRSYTVPNGNTVKVTLVKAEPYRS